MAYSTDGDKFSIVIGKAYFDAINKNQTKVYILDTTDFAKDLNTSNL